MIYVTQAVTVTLGLLAGGLFLLGLGFLPYWQSLELAEFNWLFSTSVPFVASVMKPLGFSVTGVTLLITSFAVWKKLPPRNWLIATSVFTLLMFATFPAYFSGANASLAEGVMSAQEVAQELKQWQLVHWFRTIAAIAACFCAVSSGYVSTRNSQ